MRGATAAFGLFLAFLPVGTTASDPPRGPDPAAAALEDRFRDTVQPFLGTYCLECHGKEKPKGDLDLSAYPSVDAVARDHDRWELILEQLEEEAMPPSKAKRHPKAELRQEVIGWIE